MVKLELKRLERRFKDGTRIGPIDLTVREGELLTLLGPSGSGKTTTLRMIAGFIPVESGDILFDERSIKGVPPRERRIGMVFQSIALFPNMNVFQNIAFALEIAETPRDKIIERVEELSTLLGIKNLLHRKINEISGGEGQRVALARALARNPQLLLLDEPFSALDPQLRERLQIELRRIQQTLGITTVFVTHSQQEAYAISDRIAVLNDGVVIQVGTPSQLYEKPVDEFVAKFIGSGNVIRAEVIDSDNNGTKLDFQGLEFNIPEIIDSDYVLLSVKPEDIDISVSEVEKSTKGVLLSKTPQIGSFRLLIAIGDIKIVAVIENGIADKLNNYVGKEVFVMIDEKQVQILNS